MKKLKLLLSLAFASLILISCQAQEVTQNREVSGFNGISVSEGIRLELTMDQQESVQVTANEDIIDDVITEVSGTTLKVYIKGNNFRSFKRTIHVKVTAIDINNLSTSSGSNLRTTNTIESNQMHLSASSGSNLQTKIKCLETQASTSSGAQINVSGITRSFEGDASSGSHLKAADLESSEADLDVSSGANIEIKVKEKLIADASSGGSIRYNGNPAQKDIDKSSGGSVHPR